jgi:hypothetical protein
MSRKILFPVLLAFLIVAFLEVTLTLLSRLSPRVNEILTSYTAPHERFGARPHSAIPEYDSKGYRNPKVPSPVDIVTLGDSQTFGAGVAAEDAWPRQFEAMTRKTIYNMAVSGYGPVDSLRQWDEAVALHPRVVIEGFYAGNDLYDSFNLVYNKGQHPEFKVPEPRERNTIEQLEKSAPIAVRVARMYSMQGEGERNPGLTNGVVPSIRQLLSKHSKLWGLLRRTKSEIESLTDRSHESLDAEWKSAQAFAHAHQEFCEVFSNEQFRTIFTSEYRFAALNLEDPRMAEGLRISLAVMKRLNEQAAASHTRFVVVLIPTKETVFREQWQNPSANFRTLTETEDRLWKTTKEFLKQNDIEFLEALPALREQLGTSMQSYPVSQDGHPNEAGHRAIAKAVAAYFESH